MAQHLIETALAAANQRYTLDPRRQQQAAELLRITPEDMRKTLAYAADRYRFGLVSGWSRVLAVLAFVALGGLGLAERWALALGPALPFGAVGAGLVFFALLGLAGGLFDLPFSLYATFVVEERHGFNRQTLRGFFVDLAKGLAIAVVLGGTLLAILLLSLEKTGSVWWLWAWAAVTGFGLLTAWIYPTLLAPLFNAFIPLPDGELKKRIESLAAKLGFRTRGIFVMDASRRSTHGNAYFTGLLGAKRIVLFDTLVQGLGVGEIVAVLAHELGHFKLNHVRWSLVRGALVTGVSLYVASLALPLRALYTAFGLAGPSSYGALAALSLWFAPLGFVLQPLFAAVSRRNEFAADTFAVGHLGGARELGDALLALREKSHALPLSHPLYSRVYYSHPPLVERLMAMGYAR